MTARVVRTLLALTACLLAAAALGAAEASAADPACPDSVVAPSAIVIEVSTGEVACARDADERRSVASTTKLMTALLALERAELSDVFTAARYYPPPVSYTHLTLPTTPYV